MNRRGFLAGMIALGVATPIVRADSLMRVIPIDTSLWLTRSNLEDAIIDLIGARDERGLFIGTIPRKLIVAPQLAFAAQRLLEPFRVPSDGFNALVTVLPELEIDHYATNPNEWKVVGL